jgi:hypothetical protein
MTEPTPEASSDHSPESDEIDDDALDPRARDAMRKLRRECQSLRGRLKDSEEQLGAAAREAAHQRVVVEAAAKAAGLIDGSDIWSAHPDPSEFIDEQFADIVPDRVAEATKALITAKPYLARPVGVPPTDRPLEGLGAGARAPEDAKPAPTWHSALRGS